MENNWRKYAIENDVKDLAELSPAQAVARAYREYKVLEAEMKLAKARRDYARARMEAEMESSGMTDFGDESVKVKLTHCLAPKIEDYDALIEYVHELQEPSSTYLEERFIRPNKKAGVADPLEVLIDKAVKRSLAEGKSIKECLPPGLSIVAYNRFTVTLRGGGEQEGRFKDLDDVLGGDE